MSSANKKHTKCGNWISVVSADLIVSDSVSIDETIAFEDALYYIERRPEENGRCVIVKATEQKSSDILPAPYSARTRVHEYGGGCYCIDTNLLFFVNDSDQDIYLLRDNLVSRITTEKNRRFADISYDRTHHRLIAVCETHEDQSTINTIVEINIQTGLITTLINGSDFYASPKINSSCSQISWQSWNHPNMPWDGNQLWLGQIAESGHISKHVHIAGTENISIFQPRWSPDDILYYISDDTGWWHLYRYLDGTKEHEQLTSGDREFGLPQWVFAQSTYAFINKTKIICCYKSQSQSTLATLTLGGTSKLTEVKTQWQDFSSITASNNKIGFIAASGQCFPQLISATINEDKPSALTTAIIKNSSNISISNKYYSIAQPVTFTNRHGNDVHANYYPPTNPDYQVDDDDRPPLIVICHGGPTGQSSIALDPKKQFWTSRGFALLDVNYSGSTGYGKNYRLRLNGKWGKLDVEDCCDAALYAARHGLADNDQLIIRGSSAGGYTVLSALTFEDVFSAGASYYGISELTSLASDTHKFESRYLDRLIGPYPESKKIYEQRSPINFTEQLNCPVIFFQGIEDKVVPKQQAESMFNALKNRDVTVAAQYFEGEQHGFRKAETIKHSLENELSFYQLIFNLKAKDEITFKGEISIENS